MRTSVSNPAPRPALWAQALAAASVLFALAAIGLLGMSL